MQNSFEFKVKHFRKMEPPILGDNVIRYVMYVEIGSIQENIMDSWSDTNPRLQNLDTQISTTIKESLVNRETNNFHLLNKGIVFSVENAQYDNRENKVKISFSNPKLHGNIDGGHTLRIITETLKKHNYAVTNIIENKYVFVEILEGIDDIHQLVEISSARNRTSQVTEATLQESLGAYDQLKEIIRGHYIEEKIAYKQNQLKNSKKKHATEETLKVEIRDIISILMMFNFDIYKTGDNPMYPIQAYSSKETVLKKFIKMDKVDREKWISDIKHIVKEILDLYNEIQLGFPTSASNKRYGAFAFSGHKEKNSKKTKQLGEALFSDENLEYIVPDGIIKPILAAFRANVNRKDDGTYEWVYKPLEIWEENKAEIAERSIEYIRKYSGNNPQKFGKDNESWKMLFAIIEKSVMKRKYEKLEELLIKQNVRL